MKDSELYWCGSAERAEPPARGRYLVTPMGNVRLGIELGDAAIAEGAPAAAFRLPRGGRLLCWEAEAWRAELLVVRPSWPPFAAIDGDRFVDGWAAMWRVRARRPLAPCTFACEWETLPAVAAPQGPAPGEGLEALTWWGGGLSLTMGTEDAEFIAARSARGEGLPPAWSERLVEPVWPYTEGGLRRTLPSLAAGELCQVHFVVAWAEEDEEAIESWLAVDYAPAAILAGAGCA